jgi:glycerophosphoryl diester phosphodiesterase
VRRECADLQVLLNVPEKREEANLEPDRSAEAICRRAVSACCCGINIDFTICSARLVRYARLRYLPVSVWTVDRAEDMSSMIAMGVHSITTYQPASLKQVLTRPPFLFTFTQEK